MDEVFKALADPSRRQLLDELFERDGQSLMTSRRRGREKLHFLNPVPIQVIYERWVSKYAASWAAPLTRLKHDLEEEDR
jgi:hypothetical protein